MTHGGDKRLLDAIHQSIHGVAPAPMSGFTCDECCRDKFGGTEMHILAADADGQVLLLCSGCCPVDGDGDSL